MKVLNVQSGNVLVFILIATGLFAFLTYAILQSGSDANMGSISQRDMDLAVHEMIRYGDSIEAAIDQMVMLNGVADNEISFESASDSPATLHQNANCTSDICKVFSIAGGGITWRSPPAQITETAATPYIFSGHSSLYGHGSDGLDGADAELFLSVSVTEDACVAIGDILDIPFDDTAGPEDDFLNGAFTGVYTSTTGKVIDHADLIGQKAFCFKNTTDSKYYFVYVLLAR